MSVAVAVAVGVSVGTDVSVAVAVAVGVSVGTGVSVAVDVAVCVSVGTGVSVAVAVPVGVSVGIDVSVAVGVSVGTGVSVWVAVAVGVSVGTGVSVAVAVVVEVSVGTGVSVAVAVAVGVSVGTAVGMNVSVGVARARGVSVARAVTRRKGMAVDVGNSVRLMVATAVACAACSVAFVEVVSNGLGVVAVLGVSATADSGVAVSVPARAGSGVTCRVVVGARVRVGEGSRVAVAKSTTGGTSVLVGCTVAGRGRAVVGARPAAGGIGIAVAAIRVIAGLVGDTNRRVRAAVAVDGKLAGVFVRAGIGVQVRPVVSKLGGVADDRAVSTKGAGRGSVATRARAATLTTIVKMPPIMVQMRCSELNLMRRAASSRIETSIRPAPKRNSKAAITPTMTRLAVSTIPASFSLVGKRTAVTDLGADDKQALLNQATTARNGQRAGGEGGDSAVPILNYSTIPAWPPNTMPSHLIGHGVPGDLNRQEG